MSEASAVRKTDKMYKTTVETWLASPALPT